MKRRNFLGAVGASLAALPLLKADDAWATNKSSTKSSATKKGTVKKPASATSSRTSASPAVDSSRVPLSASAFSAPQPPEEPWRGYELLIRIARLDTGGPARAWLPLALTHDTDWQRLRAHRWRGNFDRAGLERSDVDGMEIFGASWDKPPAPASNAAGAAPLLEIVSRIEVRERRFDLTRRYRAEEDAETLRRALRPLSFLADPARLRQSAEQIIGRVKDPLARGKAIYDWLLESRASFTAPENVGIATLFAQPEAIATAMPGAVDEGTATTLLFVGLCRAAGLPARPLFGCCVDSSRLSPSLGCSGQADEEGWLSAMPRCRAEFFAPGYGWIPVAPGEARQAILQDGGNLGESKSKLLKKLLFGFWEMNWIAFNAATEVVLPDSGNSALPFFTAPLAARSGGANGNGGWLEQPGAFAWRLAARRVDPDALPASPSVPEKAPEEKAGKPAAPAQAGEKE
ncbi:MAG: transglutaminase domain-containing protein [Betaproteobacteria bacterium]|nr:transglutaminase domain-containing protein [Betaproteobacteria bacterium]